MLTSQHQRLSLRSNFSWTFVGNLVYGASQWAILTVLARLGSPATVGRFALGIAISSPIMIFARLQLRGIQATDAAGEFKFGHYLTVRLLAALIAMAVISVLVWSGNYSRETAIVICIVGLAKAFELISDVFYGLLQRYERMDYIAVSMILKGLLSLFSVWMGMYLMHSLIWGVTCLAVAWLIVLIAYDIPICDKTFSRDRWVEFAWWQSLSQFQPSFDAAMLKRLTIIALPLGIVVTLDSFWTNLPRYFIERYCGERQLGIFAAVASLMLVGGTVINALGQSSIARLSQYYLERKLSAFTHIVLKLFRIGATVGIVGFLICLFFGREILRFAFGAEYALHNDVLCWLMAAMALQYTYVFCGSAVYAMRQFKIQLPIHTVSFLLVLLLSFLWIPHYGLMGAAWAMFGANVFETVAYILTLLYLYRKESYSLPHKAIVA